MLARKLWYVFSHLPLSDPSSSSSLSDDSFQHIPAPKPPRSESSIPAIVMDTCVATHMLDGALLSNDEKADQLLYVNHKMKVAVEQRGSILSFPPCQRAVTIFEWVRKNCGNFRVAITTTVCAELRSTPAVSDGSSFGANSRLQDACPAVVGETLMCTCANNSDTVAM